MTVDRIVVDLFFACVVKFTFAFIGIVNFTVKCLIGVVIKSLFCKYTLIIVGHLIISPHCSKEIFVKENLFMNLLLV